MKKIVYLSGLAAIFIISGAVFAQQKKKTENRRDLKTVAAVDLKRYVGKWYEIARLPNKFQKDCVGNVSAHYALKDNGRLEVINECLKQDGIVNRAKGEGKIVDKATNAKLEVRFAPAILSFLPAVWGDYWIIDLDENYQYAVIGEPEREYFWILSRTPEMSDAVYQDVLRRAESQGFNPGKVVKTPQNVEAVKGAAIEKQ